MMSHKGKKALVAMSGGVDSSVAALLSMEQGLDCTGSMLKLFSNEDIDERRDGSCCSLADARDARAVALSLGIPFYVFDFKDEFKKRVVRRFIEAYQNGETPNPCIDCNRFLKFDKLLQRSKELGMDYIVTGHYAQIKYDTGSGRRLLIKGADSSKDQSYVLYSMTQEQLSRTIFPLGGLHKPDVREIAARHGFVNAGKRDSQDICFVPDGDYAGFIRLHTGGSCPRGRITDVHGNDLGEHKGIVYYTVGQRRGLGLSAETSLYVLEIRADSNTVVVGTDDELYGKSLTARDINLIATDRLDGVLRVSARIRYGHKEQPATVCQLDDDTLRVEFDEPQRAITRGQAVVLYDGDVVIGGGTICKGGGDTD